MAIPIRGNAPGPAATARDNEDVPTVSSTASCPSERPCSDTQDAALAATDPGTDESANVASLAATTRFSVLDWETDRFQSLIGRGGMGAVYKARDGGGMTHPPTSLMRVVGES